MVDQRDRHPLRMQERHHVAEARGIAFDRPCHARDPRGTHLVEHYGPGLLRACTMHCRSPAPQANTDLRTVQVWGDSCLSPRINVPRCVFGYQA